MKRAGDVFGFASYQATAKNSIPSAELKHSAVITRLKALCQQPSSQLCHKIVLFWAGVKDSTRQRLRLQFSVQFGRMRRIKKEAYPGPCPLSARPVEANALLGLMDYLRDGRE